MAQKSNKERVLAAVAAIPEGRLTTYGGLGKTLQLTARQVAAVLSRLTMEDVDSIPWHRVVGSGGMISTMKLGAVGRRQIERLEAEGVTVSARGKIAGFARVCL